MANKRATLATNLDMVLYQEIGGLCPLCGIQLLYSKNGIKGKKKVYEIAHIYPLNPTQVEEDLLKNEERLSSDVNDIKNLILLCPVCHTKFDKPRTLEGYKDIFKIKKELIAKEEGKSIWHDYKVESDIEKIIGSLIVDTTLLSDKDFNYSPTNVDKKANNTLQPITKNKIKYNVSTYYMAIKKLLSNLEKEEPDKAIFIASQIKTYYLALKIKKLNQQEIFYNLVEWIHSKSQIKSRDASEAFISFYVQNCEVFEIDNA